MDFRTRISRERSALLDLTPMIDVVFLLIIFFLTTAQFARLTRADVDLPREPGEGLEDRSEPGVIVNLRRDGTIIVDEEELDIDDLRDIIDREIALQPDGDASKVKLLIRADRNLSSQRLNEIVRVIQDMGIGLGRFGTEVPR